ncbi:MAG: hypothetical protein E3J66_03480 [Dehalococcoidia bacterium]|nr:MAG: hypothetical protein E3J66_03480 [Dehalococcoidia bacterium]
MRSKSYSFGLVLAIVTLVVIGCEPVFGLERVVYPEVKKAPSEPEAMVSHGLQRVLFTED